LTPLTHRVRGFPTLRLPCPFRLAMEALEFRWALAYLLPTFLSILPSVSRVRHVGLNRDDLGGAFPSAPIRSLRFPSIVHRVAQVYLWHLPRYDWNVSWLTLLSLDTEVILAYWLTFQARSVRVHIPRRAIHASGGFTMSSLSQELPVGDLPSPHNPFQEHAAHPPRWPGELSSNGSSGTCIPEVFRHSYMPLSRRTQPVW